MTTTMHGIYVGNDPGAVDAHNARAGAPVANALNYLNNDSWAAFDSSVPWVTGLWHDSPTPSVWSVPLTVWGTPLEEVATGAHNGSFLAAAQALAQQQPSADGNIYVRVGWEFNGDWMPWAAAGHEQAFVQSYHQLVDTFRGVSDKFKFVWDVNNGGGNMADPTTAYPGDAYVDVIGMDTYYNKQWDPADPHAAFQQKVDQPFGLQWQQDFAAMHGKATAISEWGIQSDDAGPFIEDMAAWLSSHDVAYDNYWESNAAGYAGELSQYPNAAAAYKAAFASDAAAPPAEPGTAPPAEPAATSPAEPAPAEPGPVAAGGSGSGSGACTPPAPAEPAVPAPVDTAGPPGAGCSHGRGHGHARDRDRGSDDGLAGQGRDRGEDDGHGHAHGHGKAGWAAAVAAVADDRQTDWLAHMFHGHHDWHHG